MTKPILTKDAKKTLPGKARSYRGRLKHGTSGGEKSPDVSVHIFDGTRELIAMMNADYQARLNSEDFAHQVEESINWDECILCRRGNHVSKITGVCPECSIFLDKEFEKKVRAEYKICFSDN